MAAQKNSAIRICFCQRGFKQPPKRDAEKRDGYELEDRIGKKTAPRPASQDEAGDNHKRAKVKENVA